MSQEFKEVSRLWFDYETVHRHARNLYDQIQARKIGSAVLIALGRGGWFPTRLVAASFEEHGIPVETATVSAAYRNLGSPAEDVVITQSLDPLALERVGSAIEKQFPVWLIDGPYLTGKSVAKSESHLGELFKANNIATKLNVGVLEWVQFNTCPDAPWREQAERVPDAYGVHIELGTKPYIEYPWEYSTAWQSSEK